MRHTVLDIADSTACASPYDRNELQTMYAMMTAARPMHEQAMPKHVISKQALPAKKTPLSARRLAIWWQRRKLVLGRVGLSRVGLRANNRVDGLTTSKIEKNPQRAASPLMSHCPAERSMRLAHSGRRAPGVPAQQALFAVLAQMGARHSAARSTNPFSAVLGGND